MDSFDWKNSSYITFYHNNHKKEKSNKQTNKEKNSKTRKKSNGSNREPIMDNHQT